LVVPVLGVRVVVTDAGREVVERLRYAFELDALDRIALQPYEAASVQVRWFVYRIDISI